MKRYFFTVTVIATFIYLPTMFLVRWIINGNEIFRMQLFFELIISGLLFIAFFFGSLWLILRPTLGYLDSDSFDEPVFGHKLVDEFDTAIRDFNLFRDVFQKEYPILKFSAEKKAVKFANKLSLTYWPVGGEAYLNPETGKVRVVIMPFVGYTRSAEKLMNSEMERVKKLLLG